MICAYTCEKLRALSPYRPDQWLFARSTWLEYVTMSGTVQEPQSGGIENTYGVRVVPSAQYTSP